MSLSPASSLLLVILLLGPLGDTGSSALVHSFSTKGREESFVVGAGETRRVEARFGASRFTVMGAVWVSSCCELGSHDIRFSARGLAAEPYTVVSRYEFEFKVEAEQVSLVFDNSFSPGSASFHDKSVRLVLTMMGENVFYFGNVGGRPLVKLSMLPFAIVGGLVILALPVLIVLAVLSLLLAAWLLFRSRSTRSTHPRRRELVSREIFQGAPGGGSSS